jgi:hypothetical protein
MHAARLCSGKGGTSAGASASRNVQRWNVRRSFRLETCKWDVSGLQLLLYGRTVVVENNSPKLKVKFIKPDYTWRPWT